MGREVLLWKRREEPSHEVPPPPVIPAATVTDVRVESAAGGRAIMLMKLADGREAALLVEAPLVAGLVSIVHMSPALAAAALRRMKITMRSTAAQATAIPAAPPPAQPQTLRIEVAATVAAPPEGVPVRITDQPDTVETTEVTERDGTGIKSARKLRRAIRPRQIGLTAPRDPD